MLHGKARLRTNRGPPGRWTLSVAAKAGPCARSPAPDHPRSATESGTQPARR